MIKALISIWSDCKFLMGTLGIIGLVISAVLLRFSEATKDDYGMPKEKENALLKYLGLSILLISIGAIGYNIYHFYGKECRKAMYDWKAGNI